MKSLAVSQIGRRLCAFGALSLALVAGCVVDPGTGDIDSEIEDPEDVEPASAFTNPCTPVGQAVSSSCMCGFLTEYFADGLGGEYAVASGPGSCGQNTCTYGQHVSKPYCNHSNEYVLRYMGGSQFQTWWLRTCNPAPCIP